ncbi:MAG: hypothetical protein KF901_20730 [Myxococcales bacterium]|nr:hypothetical protein [Myxococcales bacterium]
MRSNMSEQVPAWLWVAGLVAALLPLHSAAAQTPVTYTQRGIVEAPMTLRLDFGPPDRTLLDSGVLGEGYGLRIQRFTDDPGRRNRVIWGNGLAFTPTHNLEFGIKAVPLLLVPRTEYLDLEVYGRFAFFQSRHVDIGGQLVLEFPTHRFNRTFGMGIGMPMAFRIHPRVRLDVGVELELFFYECGPDRCLDAHLDLPLAIAFNVTQRVFFGVRSGLIVMDFDAVRAPLGGFFGATVGQRHTADFTIALTGFIHERFQPRWELVFGIATRFSLRPTRGRRW